MLTHFHAPRSRSTRILSLRRDLGILDRSETVLVDIPRLDGSGGADPRNPHPEGKVPLLDHDGTLIWETTAIALYLTDLFPEAGLGPVVGDRDRGPYLSWLAWYGDVMEPVYVSKFAGVDAHPVVRAAFRGIPEAVARLGTALADGRPFLLGDRYSAADLICASPYGWFRDAIPQEPAIADWVERCLARPATVWAAEEDERTAASRAA